MRLLVVTGILLAPVVGLEAQETIPVLFKGTRVRVFSADVPPGTVTGQVMASSPERMQVMTQDFYRYNREAAWITRIDLSAGRSRKRGAVRGAIIGGIAGLLVGIPMRVAQQQPTHESFVREARSMAFRAGWVLTLSGLAAGAWRGSERWATVWQAAPGN